MFAAAALLLTLLGVAAIWSALRARDERADEVQAEAGTIASTAATVFNQYFSSIDAMASIMVRHPAVRSLDATATTRMFADLLTEQPMLGNVTLRRGPDGALVASAVPPPAPPPQAPQAFMDVLRTGRPVVGPLVVGGIVRRRTVQIGYPVRGDRDKVVGVIGFSLALPQLEAAFAKLPLPAGSVVALADSRNVIIARSVDGEKYIGSPLDIQPGAPRTSFQMDADGVERFHGNAIIERGPWLLSVAIPRTEVLARLVPLWRRNLLIITLFLSTIIGLAMWISWHTAIGLKRLQLAAGKIASGDLSPPERTPVQNREMAELQSSFATMAAKLREARDTHDRQFAQERKMLEAVQSLQRQVVRQERLAAVGLLVSGVAHELNNPLQAILGTIELVERQPNVPAEILEEIGFVKTQSNRARDIIRNLSRFSSQRPGTPAAVDMRDVIGEVVQLRKRDIDSASIALDVEMSSVRKVFASFTELEQVALNFVINAQQAIDGGGKPNGRILIKLTDAGKKVRLEVWDNGPGVSQSDEQKLFQPFFTTKPVGKGTGLGLSVSYGIIDAYGGAIGYFNNEWGGATFFFELPQAAD